MSRWNSQRARSKALTDCAPLRRIRSLSRIGRVSNKQVRKRKLSCSGAMADHAESFSNGHLRHPLLWTSWQNSWRVRSNVLTDLAPIRYLWMDPLLIPANQIYSLHLLVLEGARKTQKLLQPGNWRGKTFPLPKQKHREWEARNARTRSTQWQPPPSTLRSCNQAAGQVLPPPKGRQPKTHRQLIIIWKLRRIFQRIWCSRCKKTLLRKQGEP
jgi:hypothetical protein